MVLHGGPLADRERTRHPSPVHNASVDGDAGAADNPDPDARPRAQATGGEWPTRPQCMVVVCLSSGALAAGPFVGTSFAARTKDCGHVLVGPGGNAIGIADIRATRVSCARARAWCSGPSSRTSSIRRRDGALSKVPTAHRSPSAPAVRASKASRTTGETQPAQGLDAQTIHTFGRARPWGKSSLTDPASPKDSSRR
jgi:hypothetical protein